MIFMSYTRYMKRLHVSSETVIYIFVAYILHVDHVGTYFLDFCIDVYLVMVHIIVINVQL